MKFMYEAIIEPCGGLYEATFPDLDLITQGDTLADAAFMAQDLLESHVVYKLQKGDRLPSPVFGHECSKNGYRMGIVVDCDVDTPQDETMSVAEAADVLGVSESRVRAMIHDGILKSHKVGRVHRVDAKSVMDRFNAPVPAGRPKRDSMAQAPQSVAN